MRVTALDGRAVDVRRQWFPWRLRARVDPSDTPILDFDVADGLGGLVFGLVLDSVLGADKVRGWRDSSERIREIAAAYERGQDPFRTTA